MNDDMTYGDFSRTAWLRNLFFSVPKFVSWWFHSRRYRLLLQGIPAFVLGFLIILDFVNKFFYDSVDEETTRYQLAALKAIDDDDSIRAKLCIDKLHQLGTVSNESAYAAAEAEAA